MLAADFTAEGKPTEELSGGKTTASNSLREKIRNSDTEFKDGVLAEGVMRNIYPDEARRPR